MRPPRIMPGVSIPYMVTLVEAANFHDFEKNVQLPKTFRKYFQEIDDTNCTLSRLKREMI